MFYGINPMLTPIWANTNHAPQYSYAGFNSDITPEYDNGLSYYVASIPDGCPTVAAEAGNPMHASPYPATYGHQSQVFFA
mmetsp:Transcript_32260/g.50288  ORF Transcript_32260/g.50288 Transcript_32260/m.50288 type:complete len:80 (-) Transcript_32260:163-402(-)|eukprot:CAMPEP_0184309994 /NCGR_PEP_ID=MMETSP1049-20130417/21943_1 /TAXON_ID=77928 /ORGANISM="Proteomonas sulcata, Strain CCMP704" /LENGTH=79 /DNA_ID=CAMNT_0026623371 /DNA_START=40 /DNA_END=279 /DNA_ORIENTATION=+